MTEPIRITAPLTDAVIEKLKAGDKVLITGVMYTARDAAHKRLIDLLNAGKELPVDLKRADSILRRAHAGKARRGHRLGWSHDKRQDGRVHPEAHRAWA